MSRTKKSKQAVIFHEKVSSRRTVDGVVHCSLSPLPMEEWNKPVKSVDYVSLSDKLSDLIESCESGKKDETDDYTRGYDEGYINALKYVRSLV